MQTRLQAQTFRPAQESHLSFAVTSMQVTEGFGGGTFSVVHELSDRRRSSQMHA